MADDWDSWKPTTAPQVEGNAAFRARQSLSRGGSVDPMAVSGRVPPARGFVNTAQSSSSSATGRQPLSGPPVFEGRAGQGRSARQPSPPSRAPVRQWGRPADDTSKALPKSPINGYDEPRSSSQRADRHNVEDRTKQKLDSERRLLDEHSSRSSRVRPRSREREDERPRQRDSDRERERDRAHRPDRNYDRERDRKRHRSAIDSDRRSARDRSRSRSRDRERPRDRRDGVDSRRETDTRDGHREKPKAVEDRAEPSRTNRIDERASRTGVNGHDERASAVRQNAPADRAAARPAEIAAPAQDSAVKSDSNGSAIAVRIEGLVAGTTESDVRTILQAYGRLDYCKSVKGSTSHGHGNKLAFEAGFLDTSAATQAVKQLDGVVADGSQLKAWRVEEAQMAARQSPDLKLKGFAVNGNKETSSLLSRLGHPPVQEAVNGNLEDVEIPSALLDPYTQLLTQAGVTSSKQLRQLVRRQSVKEYIEMLSSEFPNEPLLQGLTARWALKERLEEWLDVKEPLTMKWKSPAKEEAHRHEEETDIDLE